VNTPVGLKGRVGMSDISFTGASFSHAFRAYAVEQGNDPGRAETKAHETANETVSSAMQAEAESVDTVFISPEASKIFAQQNKQLRSVRRKSEPNNQASTQSATGKLRTVDAIYDPHRDKNNYR
jgi:hypothetical protein